MISTDFKVTVYHPEKLSEGDIEKIKDGIDSALESDKRVGMIDGYVVVEDNESDFD